MGVTHLTQICTTLITQGLNPHTPAAIITNATQPNQHTIRGTVDTLPHLAADAGIKPPAITIIGTVAALNLTTE